MELSISVRTREVDGTIREHVERRLRFSLGRFQHRVERVRVRLEDVNGPRGGVDQRCLVVVALKGLPRVVIEQLGVDPHAAIDRAMARAGRAVARQLEQAKQHSNGVREPWFAER